MKITTEKSLRNFDFWSGAKDTVKYLTDEELDRIESILEEEYPDGMDVTELNDFFWFDDDTIAEWLGYTDFEEIMHRDDEPEEEDEEPEDEDEDEAFDKFCAKHKNCSVCPYQNCRTVTDCENRFHAEYTGKEETDE